MHTDKETATQGAEGIVETDENTEEAAVRWLLDMDLSDLEERLFAVDDDGYVDQGLTDYEAEVAARPRIRGRADADDLSTSVAE